MYDLPKDNIPWYLDMDGDGYYSDTTEAESSPGTDWSDTTQGEDCDDSDEVIVSIVPDECIEPGDSIERNFDITLSSSLSRRPNGYGPTGVIFDANGNTAATYSLIEEGDPNGDGTKTYTNIAIRAIV